MARTSLRHGWKILPIRIGYCSNTYCDRRFRYDDNNVAFSNVQPHYYRLRQALILSILAFGTMPKQQQHQRTLRNYNFPYARYVWPWVRNTAKKPYEERKSMLFNVIIIDK